MRAVSDSSFFQIGHASIAPSVFIPITALPKYYQDTYLKKTLLADSLFSVDFIDFLESNGSFAYSELLDEISVIKHTIRLHNSSVSDKTGKIRNIATETGYSLATLYRKEDLFMHSDLRKLIEPSNHIYQPRDMCNLSKDFSVFEWSKPNRLAKVLIQKKLEEEAKIRGASICDRCPYNPNSRNNKKFSDRYPEYSFSCDRFGSGMIYPASNDPFNRFLSSLSDQELTYAREGSNAWRDEFMHVTKRDRPEKVNAVWFGDHHVGDVELLCGHDKSGKPIIKRPWLTCNHDSASGVLVGSVVSIRPNTMTIAEGFCRAAAFTVDSDFFGLPEIYYVDRGAITAL